MAFPGAHIGGLWSQGGSSRIDFDPRHGPHWNFACGDNVLHAVFEDGPFPEVCAECMVRECERQRRVLTSRYGSIRNGVDADYARVQRGELDPEAWLSGLEASGGPLERATGLIAETDDFLAGNCPQGDRRRVSNARNGLNRWSSNLRRTIPQLRQLRALSRPRTGTPRTLLQAMRITGFR
ncbi:MAG: hypothetical protein AAF928_07800 [Myxococcota bacterium]